MSEKLVRFGDILGYPLRSGVTVAKEQRGTGIPMVNMGELFRYSRIGRVSMARVAIDTTDQERYLLQSNDLLFARRSLTVEGAGRCSIFWTADEPTTWESSIIRARLNTAVADPRFYFYFFRCPLGREAIGSIVEQVAAAGIRSSDLANLSVPFPDLEEQRLASDVLEALDNKIAVNEQVSSTYEALLSARFAELCCDVDSVGSHSIQVSSLVEFNPKCPKPIGNAVYVDMAAVSDSSARVRDWRRRLPASGTRFMNGDTVMARITPCLENGKTAFIDFMKNNEVGLGSTEFIVMRSRPGVPAHFSYFLARSPRFHQHAITNMIGSSGRQRCSVDVLRPFRLRRPDSTKLQRFGRDAARAFTHMKSVDAESSTLAELRDALLPKLMSGELRVRDAEELIAAVMQTFSPEYANVRCGGVV